MKATPWMNQLHPSFMHPCSATKCVRFSEWHWSQYAFALLLSASCYLLLPVNFSFLQHTSLAMAFAMQTSLCRPTTNFRVARPATRAPRARVVVRAEVCKSGPAFAFVASRPEVPAML